MFKTKVISYTYVFSRFFLDSIIDINLSYFTKSTSVHKTKITSLLESGASSIEGLPYACHKAKGLTTA